MRTLITLSASRVPRIGLQLLVGFLFGLSQRTDDFFLLYAIAIFFANIAAWTTEILLPSRKALVLCIVLGVVTMLAVGGLYQSPLALPFIPLLVSISISSVLSGIAIREKAYNLLAVSTTAYLLAIPLIWALTMPFGITAVVWGLATAELARALILRRFWGAVWLTTTWASTFVAILPAAIYGLAALEDRLFASVLAIGDITRVTYATALINTSGTVLSYGVFVTVLAGERRNTVKTLAIGTALVSLGIPALAMYHQFVGHWTASLVWPAIAYAWTIPIAMAHAAIYPRLVRKQRFGLLVAVAVVFPVTNLVLNILLLPFGLIGLLAATSIASACHTIAALIALRSVEAPVLFWQDAWWLATARFRTLNWGWSTRPEPYFATAIGLSLTTPNLTSMVWPLSWAFMGFGVYFARKDQGPAVAWLGIWFIVASTLAAIPGTLIWGDDKLPATLILALSTLPLVAYYVIHGAERVVAWLVPLFLIEAGVVLVQGLVLRSIRPAGLAENPNVAAGFLALGAVYLLSGRHKWLSIPMMAALPFTGARFVLVIMVAMIGLMLIRRYVPSRLVATTAMTVAVVVVLGWDAVAAGFRLDDGGFTRGDGTVVQSGVASRIISDLKHRLPIIRIPTLAPRGHTDDGFPSETPHNVPLRMSIETGILSGAVWLLLTGWALLRRPRYDAAWWMLLALAMMAQLYYWPWIGPIGAFWFLLVGWRTRTVTIEGPILTRDQRRRTF